MDPKGAVQVERTLIGGSLEIPRMVNGLWQLAGGHDKDVNIASASDAMNNLINRGLYAFDMADHYGDAELVIGHHNKSHRSSSTAFTKWCPAETGIKTLENAEAAVDLALSRMGQEKIELLQYHAWDYTDDTYIHNLHHLQTLQAKGKIGHIGLTNTDAAHLEMLCNSGFRIATNQVPVNVIDRRVINGRLGEVCKKHNVGILAYASLLGGFLSEKWLGQPEPIDPESLNWSLRKYLRFIWEAGGWDKFQVVLQALATIASRHQVPIAAVATRWVLDVPAVKAVIVGSRLDDKTQEYASKNLLAFTFHLTDEDGALISEAQRGLSDVPGDCGDEYRRPPFLTVTGDLSHHLSDPQQSAAIAGAISKGQRIEYLTGSKWEPIAGYCRAVRVGSTIHVSGTTANSPIPELSNIGSDSARSQTVWVLDIIERSLKALGASFSDILRTRIMIQNLGDCEEVSRAHGWRMKCAGILPANTLVSAGVVGDNMLVEIEAWAEVGSGDQGVLQIKN
ncbi:hypothetical protein E8E14_008941 [Neopestalotiopsis sp. 37M]|nr:hypothetical protein E8E14_008941 [Neopestalotiopsis sp. 37M]